MLCLFNYTGVYASTDTCWCGKEGCTCIQGLASGLYTSYYFLSNQEGVTLKYWENTNNLMYSHLNVHVC